MESQGLRKMGKLKMGIGSKTRVISSQTKQEVESHPSYNDCVISIQEKLSAMDDDDADFLKRVSIYRVPIHLRLPSHREASTPRVVSLGPYHHGMAPLQKMERQKWRILRHVLGRTNQDIKLFLNSMIEVEIEARACYEEPLDLRRDQFLEMMLLDGCFILEILQGFKCYYPIFSDAATMVLVCRDMIMLENQIPFCVLDELHQLQHQHRRPDEVLENHSPSYFLKELIQLQLQPDSLRELIQLQLQPELRSPDEKRNVVELAVAFSGSSLPTINGIQTEEPFSEMATKISAKTTMIAPHTSTGPSRMRDPQSNYCGLHCLYLFRERFLYGGPEPLNGDDKRQEKLNYCATELRDAGIKFRKGNTERLWNIEFNNGVLYIPSIMIDKDFKLLFFNLIAFEQCHFGIREQHITSYVDFLDELIDSPEDVRYLKSCGIIQHFVGSDAEVAEVINGFCHQCVVMIGEGYLSRVSWEINNYRNRSWNIWRATLKERYFNNPWSIISFVAAVLLLIMTAAQSFYAVYGYYRPNNGNR